MCLSTLANTYIYKKKLHPLFFPTIITKQSSFFRKPLIYCDFTIDFVLQKPKSLELSSTCTFALPAPHNHSISYPPGPFDCQGLFCSCFAFLLTGALRFPPRGLLSSPLNWASSLQPLSLLIYSYFLLATYLATYAYHPPTKNKVKIAKKDKMVKRF